MEFSAAASLKKERLINTKLCDADRGQCLETRRGCMNDRPFGVEERHCAFT